MKKVVRITRVDEQDNTRRADCLAMTPNARVAALLAFRHQVLGSRCAPLKRVTRVRRLTSKHA